MKKLYCNLSLFFSIVFVLFSTQNAFADRAAAGEIAYKWVSDSTYLLTYSFYRDCSGATLHPTTINVCYSNGCNPDNGNVTLPLKTPLLSNGQVVQSGWCGTPNTVCTGGTMKGYRKWVYEGTVTLPSRCANWRFVVSISARNLGITNITAGATSVLHSETSLNNLDVTQSSSPTFNLDLIQYMCAGSPQYYNYSGVDADGDVLTYNLVQPATAADNQTTCTFPPAPSSIPFGGVAAGTSLATDPFATTNTFNLDPTTGIMTFTPDAGTLQQAQLTLQVTKRRGTKIISQVTRDIQFVISNTCAAYPFSFAVNKTASSNVLWRPPTDTAEVCPDFAHKICFTLSSIDPTVTITNITDNHTTFSQTASTSTMSAYSGVGSNNVSACFDWTPKEEDGGTRFLVIKSEVCRPNTPKVYRIDTIRINTIKKIGIKATDTFICLGESTNLCIDPKGTGPWNWCVITGGIPICTGTLGLSLLDDTCTSYTPSSTTYVMVTDSSIRNTCQRIENPSFTTNQKEIKIVVVNPRIDAGPDTVICAYKGSTLQMNGNLINPQPELTYAWKWTLAPGTGNASDWLNDTSLVNPLLTMRDIDIDLMPDSLEFFLEVVPSPGERCFKSDRVVVYILKGFYILTGDQLSSSSTGLGYKGRQKGISDTAICAGQSILLQGWGDPGYSNVSRRYTWVWTPAAGVSQPDTFYGGAITLTPTGTMTFALTASKTGCRDSTKLVNIVVEESPTVEVGPDRAICFGDTVNLFAEIDPDPDGFPKPVYTYRWWPGGALARPDTFFTYFTGYRSEKIYFTAATPAGCTGMDSLYISVEPRSFLTIGNDTAICPGEKVKISVAGDALLQSVTWKPGNANIDSVHSLTPVVSPAFTTDYVVLGLDSNRCIDSAVLRVTVHPKALIYLEDSVTIYPGDVYQIEPQGNSLYYTWFPPVGLDYTNIANPKASPLLNTMYRVKAMTDAGCSVEDSIYIFVAPDSYIDIPNAFVPGRGTENNVFKPVHLGNASLKSFSIFNRWGIKVFETTDINEGWDGSFGGKPQPLGVYVYLLEAVTAKGVPIVKQGNVTLVR